MNGELYRTLRRRLPFGGEPLVVGRDVRELPPLNASWEQGRLELGDGRELLVRSAALTVRQAVLHRPSDGGLEYPPAEWQVRLPRVFGPAPLLDDLHGWLERAEPHDLRLATAELSLRFSTRRTASLDLRYDVGTAFKVWEGLEFVGIEDLLQLEEN